MIEVDITVENHGTIFLFHAHTVRASDWINQNVDDAPLFGAALAVEHRYALDLAEGMEADGLVLG